MGESSERELLTELVSNSRKQLLNARIRTLASIVTAGVAVICLVILMPAMLDTMGQIKDIIRQASETITYADEAIGSITEMSAAITTMGENMDAFITENSESVAAVMEKIGSVDFESLNKAIKDLGDVVAPLAKFFNIF